VSNFRISVQQCPICKGKMHQDTRWREDGHKTFPVGSHCTSCGATNQFNTHIYDNDECPSCRLGLALPSGHCSGVRPLFTAMASGFRSIPIRACIRGYWHRSPL
jgi:hypothetical protein